MLRAVLPALCRAVHSPPALCVRARHLGLVPIVLEQTARGERAYDIFSRLLKVGSGAEELPGRTRCRLLKRGAPRAGAHSVH